MIFNVNGPKGTEDIAKRLAKALISEGRKRAFIALSGEMGVGKTVFCRAFSEALGISGVKSPTYTIVNEHRSADGVHLYHFDLYRIESDDDLESIGYYDYIEKDGFSLVEWPSHAGDGIPTDAINVKISRVLGDEEKRTIEIDGITV